MRLLALGLGGLAAVAVGANFFFDASREASRRGGAPGIGDVLTAAPVAPLSVPAAVTGAQNSVFYVQGPQGAATAFLVDAENLIFATNAHVPRKILAPPPGQPGQPAMLTLRQANNLKFECKIEPQDVREHPGHELLAKLVDSYSPVVARPLLAQPPGVEKLKIKPLRFTTLVAMLGFDGAILKARKENCNLAAAKPPRALELASPEDLAGLGSGNLIARISFPGGSGNANAEIQDLNTIPRVDIGYIRAVDGYVPQPDKALSDLRVRHLVAHTLPSAGGTSGGPFLNAAGKVVAVNQGGLVLSGNLPVFCYPVSPVNMPAILQNAAPCKAANDGDGRLVSRLDGSILTQAVARENFAHRAELIRDLIGGETDESIVARYTTEIGEALRVSLPLVDVLENLNLQQIEGLANSRSAAFDPAAVTTQKHVLTYDADFFEKNCINKANPATCAVRYVKRVNLVPSRSVAVQAVDTDMGNLCDMEMELVQAGTNVRLTAAGQKPVLLVGGPLPSADFDLVLTRKAGCTGQAEYLEPLTWNAQAVLSQFDLTPGSAPAQDSNRLMSAIEAARRSVRQTVDLIAAPPKEDGSQLQDRNR